jgi:N-acyl-phosphatidylethanolamine-hydrolysing phospholipase D
MKRRDFLGLALAAGVSAAVLRWTLAPRALRAQAGGRGGNRPDALPPHHDPRGGFRNPWETAQTRESGGFLRWQRERRRNATAPNPTPEQLPRERPRIARPGAAVGEMRVTWVGHATFLIQVPGLNILTDPHWSQRASPVQFAGPSRFSEPGIEWDDLPRIDAVLLSHDHYDHLDEGTVLRLRDRFGDGIRWFTPLEYRRWFRSRGVTRVSELDWWQEIRMEGPEGDVRIVCLPCQHWTSRGIWDRARKLWSAWAVIAPDGTAVFFGGDSGYYPEFHVIRDRVGTFDVLILPIGAYEPRWFMRPAHMNPEEAVRAYLDLGGVGTMIGMHWGTWRLTDEDPLEPPVRTRTVWDSAGLPRDRLQILALGGTWSSRRGNPA